MAELPVPLAEKEWKHFWIAMVAVVDRGTWRQDRRNSNLLYGCSFLHVIEAMSKSPKGELPSIALTNEEQPLEASSERY